MRLPENWKKARVTVWIAAATAAAWLIASLFQLDDWVAVRGGFWPGQLRHVYGEGWFVPLWLTPLTATLVHGGFLHLSFNLLFLLYCGRPVEANLGPAAMAILYVTGAYAAAGAQFLANPVSAAPMIGASGAISAVVGAYAILFGRNKVKIANRRLAVWLNALWLMAAWVVLQLAMGIIMTSPGFVLSQEGVSIAVAAHIGGFLAGLLLANPLLLYRYRKA